MRSFTKRLLVIIAAVLVGITTFASTAGALPFDGLVIF